MIRPLILVTPLTLLAGPAFADSHSGTAMDCDPSANREEVARCAQAFYRDARDDMAQAYERAEGRAEELGRKLKDEYGSEAPDPTASGILAEAQDAWNTYMDRACTAESYEAWGEPAAPLTVYACRERLTRQRIDDLRAFGDEG